MVPDRYDDSDYQDFDDRRDRRPPRRSRSAPDHNDRYRSYGGDADPDYEYEEDYEDYHGEDYQDDHGEDYEDYHGEDYEDYHGEDYERDLDDGRYGDYDRRPPRSPTRARAATLAPRNNRSSDRQIYDRYQRSRSDIRSRSRPSRARATSSGTHQAAVDAYRLKKARQGVLTTNSPVRVARRARPPRVQGPRARDRGFYTPPKRRKDKWAVAKSIVVLVILVIVFLVPFAANVMPEFRDVLMSDLTEPSPRLLPVTAEYNMDRVFTLTVAAGTVNYNLKVPRPSNIPDAQEIIDFSQSPSGSNSGSDVVWSGSASSTLKITVSYHFKATTVKWAITPETSGTPSDVPAGKKKFLGDEWKIKPSNQEIRTLASEIAGDKDTVYEKLKEMSDWMRNNILYEKQRGWQPKDPLQTLSDGTGDCDDQSMLFASLARAQGIPVWMEMGALYDQFQKAWGGHAWLKAYVPLVTGGGMEVNMDPANKEFLVRDPWRITEWESDGDGDHLQEYYTLWQFSYSGYASYDAGAKYMDLGYKRSTETVSDKPPGSGTQAWKDSWRIPGFEMFIWVPAISIAVVLVRRKTKKKLK